MTLLENSLLAGDQDMMNVKRVRFKDTVNKANHLPSHGFDGCSLPCEVTQALSSNAPKTSEYAFFKKLKQDVSGTSRPDPVDRGSICTRKFSPSNNVGEYKEAKSLFYVKKPTSGDDGFYMSPRDASQERSGMTRKALGDHEEFKSSFLIRTPTMIELDSFLSTTANSLAKPESQLKDGDIFSSKRLKLRHRIEQTLFPETEEIPKECDLISLLLHRLLPESSENTQLENPNIRQAESQDKFQFYPSPDSNIQLIENWGTSERSHFQGSGGSAAWSQNFKGRLPSNQVVQGTDSWATRCANRKLLEYRKHELESSLNDINSKGCLNRFGHGNLLTWSNEDYDHSTECWPNRFGDENFSESNNEDYDFSTPCSTSTNILKHQVHNQFSYDGVRRRHQSSRSVDKTRSYGVPNGSYGSFEANGAKRTGLEYKDERFDCNLDRRTKPSYLNDIEVTREANQLLLGWDTDQTDMPELSHINDMELDVYALPSSTLSDHHLHSPKHSTLLHLPYYPYQDHHHIQNHLVSRSRCAPFSLSYGLEQLESDAGDFIKNLFRGSSFFFLPQMHYLSSENMECVKNHSSVEALMLSEGTNSDLGLNCNSMNSISETQYDKCTDEVLQVLRRDGRSSQFFLENENELAISQLEDWSSVSVHNPSGQEVSFPLKLHKVRWIDAEGETYHDDSGTTTSDGSIW